MARRRSLGKRVISGPKSIMRALGWSARPRRKPSRVGKRRKGRRR